MSKIEDREIPTDATPEQAAVLQPKIDTLNVVDPLPTKVDPLEGARLEVEALNEAVAPHVDYGLNQAYLHDGVYYRKRVIGLSAGGPYTAGAVARRIEYLDSLPAATTHAAFHKVNGAWAQVFVLRLAKQIGIDRHGYSFPSNQVVTATTLAKAKEAVETTPEGLLKVGESYMKPEEVEAWREQERANKEFKTENRAARPYDEASSYVDNPDKLPMPQGSKMEKVTMAKTLTALAAVPKTMLPLVGAMLRSKNMTVGVSHIVEATDAIQAYLEEQTDLSSRRLGRMARELAELVLYGFVKAEGIVLNDLERAALRAAQQIEADERAADKIDTSTAFTSIE